MTHNQALDLGMKAILSILVAFTASVQAGAPSDLAAKIWNHGSKECTTNGDPPIEVHRFDDDTFILRQNKCVHFEAPFLYVLFGETMVLVLDTGATADPERFPLYDTLQALIAERNNKELTILVVHSHSHSDHTAADSQFRGRSGVILAEPTAEAVRAHFGFTDWPAGTATIDLGQRVVEVIPAPGHQDEGIALYDSRTGWLLAGDNAYPGRLYVKNWNEYRSSIARLLEFSKTHQVSAVLGGHVEMSASGTLFPPGSTFQPDEARLPLTVEDLTKLNASLGQAGERPREIAMANFTVTPIGIVQRTLASVLKWLGFR